MRKRGAKFNRAKAPPGLVAQAVHVNFEIRLRQAALAFAGGWPDPGHFNDLVDTLDLIQIALNSYSKQKPNPSMCNLVVVAREVLDSILEQHDATGTIAATPDQACIIELLVNASIDFWNRRSGVMYAHAFNELHRIRERQAAEKEQAQGQAKEAACPTP